MTVPALQTNFAEVRKAWREEHPLGDLEALFVVVNWSEMETGDPAMIAARMEVAAEQAHDKLRDLPAKMGLALVCDDGRCRAPLVPPPYELLVDYLKRWYELELRCEQCYREYLGSCAIQRYRTSPSGQVELLDRVGERSVVPLRRAE